MLNKLTHIHRQIDYSAVIALVFVIWGMIAATQIVVEAVTIMAQEHQQEDTDMRRSLRDAVFEE